MGLERRVKELETRLGIGVEEGCPQCHGYIVTEVVRRDGRREFPHGPPCEVCDSRADAAGPVSRITYHESGG